MYFRAIRPYSIIIWENCDFIINTKIDYKSNIKYSNINEIENLLIECFKNICGYNSYIK